MGLDKTSRLINNLKKQDARKPVLASNVVEGFVMPNHSGIKQDPVLDYEIATKKYVDDNAGGAPEGTAVKSTGVSTGYFLEADGDNTSSWQQVLLDDVQPPSADTSFSMANKQLKFSWVAPATADGAFEIEASGAFTGDLVHIHQHTGNPGAVDLMHLEADDADVTPLRVTGAGTYDIVCGPISAESVVLSADNSSADTAYVPMVLYNTDATPPAASGFPVGTLYVQYTP